MPAPDQSDVVNVRCAKIAQKNQWDFHEFLTRLLGAIQAAEELGHAEACECIVRELEESTP